MSPVETDALAPVLDAFARLRRSVRIADLLDIAVIAFCLYFAMIWLRQRTSRAAALGFLSLMFVYILSRRLDMFLTSILFQAGITAVLVALVIVFQDDVRRIIDRIAALGPFEKSHAPPAETETTIDVVTEAVATLARNRTGALLVFAGKEPLERQVRGGVRVDGRISLPLLLSIFDPHSAGHDGAVIVIGDRLHKLGAHLPLSDNLAATGSRGTRHSAGLGLSENSDAFVIIVSEERGTISVARNGRLEVLESATELKSRLEAFHRELFPPPSAARRWPWITRHASLKLAALVIAVLLWFVFAYRVDTIERTYRVPIVYRNTERVEPAEPRPTSVEVTLVGNERVFDQLDPSTMEVSLDLAQATGGEIALTPDHVNRPQGLDVMQIEPSSVALRPVARAAP